MGDLHVSWDEYNQLVEGLALQVHDSGWAFDAIVCLARGGMRVGDVFSRLFRRPLGVLFTSSYREQAGTLQEGLIIASHLSSAAPLPGRRWLLVDDLADSGVTLKEAARVLQERHPQIAELRTAVIWCKAQTVFNPDYALQRLAGNPWIHQPFEAYDRMSPAELRQRRVT